VRLAVIAELAQRDFVNVTLSILGPCVNLSLHWHVLTSVALEDCQRVNDGFLLQLLSNACSLHSLSLVRCGDVTAAGFSALVCTRLCQLEIVQCAGVEPEIVMAASVQLIGNLHALNVSYGHLGALRLHQLQHISTLIIDMCAGVAPAAAAAVVSSCRALRLLSAAGVAAFTSHDLCRESFPPIKT
jgi:hypothetical protein